MASTFWGRDRARRLAWPVVVVAALALPALTAAGVSTDTSFEGKLATGGTVKFVLHQDAGSGSYTVVNWKWNNLRIKCDSGKHKHDGGFVDENGNPIPIPVDENRSFAFEGLRRKGRGGAKVNGTFDDTYGSAKGQLKVWGRTGWGRHCRSGWVRWGAEPVTPTP